MPRPQLTATLLLVGSTFFVADGIQTIAAGSLRGMNDTRVPLLFATISYWLIGFPCAWWLGFRTPLGAVGVWIGLSVGTAVYATLLILRFRHAREQACVPMTVHEITPAVDTDALLAGAQFVDAFRVGSTEPALDARQRRRKHDGARAALDRDAVEAAQPRASRRSA